MNQTKDDGLFLLGDIIFQLYRPNHSQQCCQLSLFKQKYQQIYTKIQNEFSNNSDIISMALFDLSYNTFLQSFFNLFIQMEKQAKILMFKKMTKNYKVKKGDTLWAIGRNQVGLNWRFIHAMNPQIKNPDLIYVDQIINIPNSQLASSLIQFSELSMTLGLWRINVLISLLNFLIQSGQFNKEEIKKFMIQNGIDGKLIQKVQDFYNELGSDKIKLVYDWWQIFCSKNDIIQKKQISQGKSL